MDASHALYFYLPTALLSMRALRKRARLDKPGFPAEDDHFHNDVTLTSTSLPTFIHKDCAPQCKTVAQSDPLYEKRSSDQTA